MFLLMLLLCLMILLFLLRLTLLLFSSLLRVDISLDNPGFILTDAEVHCSDPPKSSGSSTSSCDSVLRA